MPNDTSKIQSRFWRWVLAQLTRIGVHARMRTLDEAVARAITKNIQTRQRCFVFLVKGQFYVLTKQDLRRGKRGGLFQGMTYMEIEKKALYATR